MQQRWTTVSKENGLDKPIVQRTATLGNTTRRIGALEKVAGSSPVGFPPRFRIGKPNTRKIIEPWSMLQRPMAAMD